MESPAKSGHSCLLLVLLAVSVILNPARAIAQEASASPSAEINGVVRDSSGKPIGGVSVYLRQLGKVQSKQVLTNETGTFVFPGISTGTYSIKLGKPGFYDVIEDPIYVSPPEKKHCEFVLQTAATPPPVTPQALPGGFELDDKPSFVVAGITDSTGSGGHAAETRLRTGEALAKETLKLKADNASETPKAAPRPDARDSESDLRLALRQNPRNFEANHQLGELYLHTGRDREAVPLLQAAYESDPRNYENAIDLAHALENSGDFPGTREHLGHLLSAGEGLNRTEQADLHRMMGDVDEKSGDSLEAVHEYERASALDPSEQNYFAWGSELLLHRAAAPAIEVFGKGARLHPGSARMLAGLGAALFTSGSAEEGAKRLCEAADAEPANPVPYRFLGEMQEGTSVPLSCAQEKLARFAENQPGSAQANYYYGLALWKRNRGLANADRLQHARVLFEKATVMDPKFDAAYLQLGNVEFADGKFPEAIEAYRKAIAANPEGSEAHYRLGLAYKRAGEEEQAEREFDSYKRLDKTEAEKVERQRRELRQFLFVLKDYPAGRQVPNPVPAPPPKPQ